MERKQLTKLTNQIFSLYIMDLCTSLNITKYQISKTTNISEQFFSNKLNGYSVHYVSLDTIYIIATYYNFTFDLLKYSKQLECNK